MSKEQRRVPKLRFPEFTDEWEQRKLGEVFKYEQPGAYIVKSTEYNDAFETPVLTAGQSFILGYTNETDGIKGASTDAPVIIFDDFTTSSHYVDFPFKVKSSAMKLLTLASGSDDIYCAKHVLQNIEYVPQSHERHWISKFAEFDVFMPIHEEQKKIGTFFKEIDTLITLQQRKLDQIREYKKGMLQKMFPKEGESVPEVRFPGFTGEWEQKKLGDIAEVKDSARIPNSEWCDSGVPYIRASDLSNEDISGVLFISTERYDYYRDKTGAPSQGDVLFNGGGEIGKAFLNSDDKPIYVQGGAVLYARTSVSETLDGQFLKTYFETPNATSYIDMASAGGTMKHFTLKPSLEMPIQLPNISEQIRIGNYFKSLDTFITLHQRKLEAMKEYKKGLLQQMFV